MASHFVRLMPEVDRDSTSGCDIFPAKRDVVKKPPRRNRPRNRQDGDCVGLEPPRAGRLSKTGSNNETMIDEEDKENTCGVGRCRSTGLSNCRSVASPSISPTRSRHELIYQQCLGSVIASYLSPLRGQAVTRSRLPAGRFFDTLTSPGDEKPATQPSHIGHKNDVDSNNTNTSVWLSDSTLPDIETSSGVETATSSPPETRPDGNDIITEQVRDRSKSVALCDLSRISVVSSTSGVPREQLSSLGACGGLAGVDGGPLSAFHSTFNYPLHSTLRGTSVQCLSPLPESPTSPVRWRKPNVEERRPVPALQRDLPPPACRRCGDTTPLRRQQARACLERQRPLVDRRRRSAGRMDFDADDDEEVQSASISLHATRGSLPDLSDLSTDSELDEHVVRGLHRRRRRRGGLNPGVYNVNVELPVRNHHHTRASCTHYRCQSTRPCVRRSADPLTMFDARPSTADDAWRRTSSSVDRPSCHRYTAEVPTLPRPTMQRSTGCVPNIRSRDVIETRRRTRQSHGMDIGCGHRRLLSKKLKLLSNILCTAGTADVTQLTTLGHV